MISMTTYWQQFQQCLNELPTSVSDALKETLLKTATEMVEIGLTIEKMGLTQIKGVSNELYEKSKAFNNKVTYHHNGKDYHYYLPFIHNQASLFFAILYYQHLHNYAQVQYEGEIWFGVSFVHKSLQDKKPTTHIQSLAMLDQIHQYGQKHHFNLDDKQLLKKDDESFKAYVNRLSKYLNETPAENPFNKLNSMNDIDQLKQTLSVLNNQEQGLLNKFEQIVSKLSAYHFASRHYQQQLNQWQKQGWFSKLYYWLVSWFYQSPKAKLLDEARLTLAQADEQLRQEVDGDHPVGVCIISIGDQIKSIHQQQAELQAKIDENNQAQSVPKDDLPKEKTAANDMDKMSAQVSAMNLSQVCGFFREHMPSHQVLQTVAVGAAAVALRNMTGGIAP